MATAKWFGLTIESMFETAGAQIDWDTDTIKVLLTTSAFTPNQDTHNFKDDVTNEVSGTGYTAGGITLGTKTVTYDTATNEVRLDAADIQWTGASFTARWGVVYKDTGSAATSPLIGYIDFEGDQTVTNGTFSITWDATGVLKAVAA